MSVAQNLSYTAVQVLHNLGAVSVVGGGLSVVLLNHPASTRLSTIVLVGWLTQILSGAAFGAVSWYFYRRLPDIEGLALQALYIKIICAFTGLFLMAAYLMQHRHWTETRKFKVWIISTLLATTALSAAAFLRWFS